MARALAGLSMRGQVTKIRVDLLHIQNGNAAGLGRHG